MAPDLTLEDRLETARLVRQALQRASDPLTKGLGSIAIGRLVSAQVTAGDPVVRDLESLWRQLLRDAQQGPIAERGFAVLGLGLAARPTEDEGGMPTGLRTVRTETEGVPLKGVESDRLEADLQCAYAIALVLMKVRSAVPTLVELVEVRDAVSMLRHDAAVALGQIGYGGPEVVRTLQLGLSERKRPRVQAGSALALSLLNGKGAASRLLRELEHARTSTEVLRLIEPLGYLGDPALARPLIEYARSEANADRTRALILVALGNLGDGEPRPSLAMLGRDANYPGAPPVLLDALRAR